MKDFPPFCFSLIRFLGFVNKIGMAYEAEEISSGFGVHLSLPMIREAKEKKDVLSREDAKKVSLTLFPSEKLSLVLEDEKL